MKHCLRYFGIILIASILVLSACNETSNEQSTAVTNVDSPGKATIEARALPQLNLLYTNNISYFRNAGSNDRLVFRYFVNANGHLTMRGWLYNGNSTKPVGLNNPHDPAPAATVTMEPGDLVPVSLSDTYLSSLVLGRTDLSAIRTDINSATSTIQSVYFVPFQAGSLPANAPPGVFTDDGIVWLIYTSPDQVPHYDFNKFTDTTSLQAKSIVSDAQFNPSPPREFNK